MMKLDLHSSDKWAIHHAFMQMRVLEADEAANAVESELTLVFKESDIKEIRLKGESDADSPAYHTLKQHKDLFDTMEVFGRIAELVNKRKEMIFSGANIN